MDGWMDGDNVGCVVEVGGKVRGCCSQWVQWRMRGSMMTYLSGIHGNNLDNPTIASVTGLRLRMGSD